MKIKILTLITLALVSICCKGQDFFQIKGTVANDYDGYIFLNYGAEKDSALVKNKYFSFEGTVDYPIESRLHIKNGFSASSFFLENSPMEMTVTIDNSITYINSLSGNQTLILLQNCTINLTPYLPKTQGTNSVELFCLISH
jgi:hypothetical protein